MARSFIDKSSMQQTDLQQTFQCSVDCNLIEVLFAQPPRNLVLAERPVSLEQNF
jgi:hypothetical protein